eukprot:3867425-Rhodomonas_salina.2
MTAHARLVIPWRVCALCRTRRGSLVEGEGGLHVEIFAYPEFRVVLPARRGVRQCLRSPDAPERESQASCLVRSPGGSAVRGISKRCLSGGRVVRKGRMIFLGWGASS